MTGQIDINWYITNQLILDSDKTEIKLPFSNVFGVLPNTLGHLVNLRQIYLNSNMITGPIPDDIEFLQNLRYFFLDNNNISGIIPPNICLLRHLTHINLSNNQLTGPIPENIGDLNNLKYLSLSYNQLTGTIPESIGNLTRVRQLFLEYNNLSGELPYSIANMKSLTHINTENNIMDNPKENEVDFHLPEIRTLKKRLLKSAQKYNEYNVLSHWRRTHPNFYDTGTHGMFEYHLSPFLFGKIIKPYKKFIVQNKKKKGLYFKTRFGEQKLRDDATGLYLKGNRKMYLHRWK